jgi:predicted metalloprotease with PDZ domain
MKGRGIRILGSIALFAVSAFSIGARPVGATVRYEVSLDHPERHRFGVSITIPADGREVTVAMPAWNALYQIRDFSQRVRDVAAACPTGGTVPADVRKLDKQTWQISVPKDCEPGDHNSLGVHYTIEWDDLGPFNSQLNEHHAFVNLAEILMYVPGRRSEDTSVRFIDLPAGWRTAAELAAVHVDNMYVAPSYDKLVDAPVEAGQFDEFQFESDGARFRVVVDAGNWNRRVLEEALRRITSYELQLMGGPPFDPPNREYTFIFHIDSGEDVGAGGMEHANSTAIAMRSVEAAIFVAAHEFFHVWNVKRIRPGSLEPVDFTKEQYTRALWFAEGVTSSYASYALERTGLWSKGQFYSDLAAQIGELESRPARQWQSVEESSLDAWFEKYDAYNVPDRSISYYNKGQILGVMLDLAIRDATDNHKSLDDVLRRMNVEYAQQGRFYDGSEGIRAAVEEVAGKTFQNFFRRYVSGTDEIPYNDFLSIAGLELRTKDGVGSANSGTRAAPLYSIAEIANPTDRQRRIREGLLRGTAE